MSEPLVISVDAMGGDHGPSITIPGVARAAEMLPGARFLLHGDEAAIRAQMKGNAKLAAQSEIRHAERVVAMDEKPATAMRRGKGTSMWAAVETVKTGEAAGAVSAGNTGALMAISTLILRMCVDIDRPPLVASLPGAKGIATFLDVGANVDCDAERLVEFAIMGEAFHRAAHGVARPTVGLLNVGSEDMKGHAEVREAHRILREGRFDLDYRGFVEGDDLTRGVVDVIVTDGFTGNVALKTAEGAAQFIRDELRKALTSTAIANLGAFMASGALRAFRDRLNPPPAAPLLGLNGLVVKCHGGANDRDFGQSVSVTAHLAASDFAAEIERNMGKLPAALARAETAAREAEQAGPAAAEGAA